MGRTLLTGWAIPPEFINIPADISVFDSTKAIPMVMNQNEIKEDWSRILCGEFLKTESDEIIGYSLGALLAIELAQEISFKKVTLLAPAFSFTKSDVNPHGIPPKIVRNMIRALETDTLGTLRNFHKNCGIEESIPCDYSKSELLDGLHFLLQIKLRKKEFKGSPKIEIIYAEDDRIIPQKASGDVSRYYSAKSNVTAGHHIEPLLKIFH